MINYYQLDFFTLDILPDLINFKKTCLEKGVNLLNFLLFIVFKHLADRETGEFFLARPLNFKNAFHLTKIKKLKLLKIDFKTKIFVSARLIRNRSFLSFSNNFFIIY